MAGGLDLLYNLRITQLINIRESNEHGLLVIRRSLTSIVSILQAPPLVAIVINFLPLVGKINDGTISILVV